MKKAKKRVKFELPKTNATLVTSNAAVVIQKPCNDLHSILLSNTGSKVSCTHREIPGIFSIPLYRAKTFSRNIKIIDTPTIRLAKQHYSHLSASNAETKRSAVISHQFTQMHTPIVVKSQSLTPKISFAKSAKFFTASRSALAYPSSSVVRQQCRNSDSAKNMTPIDKTRKFCINHRDKIQNLHITTPKQSLTADTGYGVCQRFSSTYNNELKMSRSCFPRPEDSALNSTSTRCNSALSNMIASNEKHSTVSVSLKF
ncbi:unnamed protein product [Thelazia callipaeda]|uniref:MSP domain-containing protein n=1 Tax=Thelazia callipaeda TaxID=103827 RepID=A0A0N5CX89_THECL|nr:unnamed protein product [Thelazia callipaeda]